MVSICMNWSNKQKIKNFCFSLAIKARIAVVCQCGFKAIQNVKSGKENGIKYFI